MSYRFLLSIVILVCGCATKPKELTIEGAMRPAKIPTFTDDLDFVGLQESLDDDIHYFQNQKINLQFGPTQVSSEKYLNALTRLKEAPPDQIFPKIQELFNCYEVQGDGKWGEAFITSYFDPVIKASHDPTAE